ncbi:MAG: hypothetical protein AAGA25_01380 [Planctomycetota bacterium]
MGWTHYWERLTELPKAEFAEGVQDILRLSKACPVGISGFEGCGEPIFEPEHVVFNGTSPQHYEPFEVSRIEFDRRGRTVILSYCKTDRKPYDLFVQAALIVFKHHLGEAFQVSSDTDDSAWLSARSFVSESLGYGDLFDLDEKQ